MEILQGVIGVVVVVFGLIVSIVWLVLPFIIISKANQIIELLRAIGEQVQMLNYKKDKEHNG